MAAPSSLMPGQLQVTAYVIQGVLTAHVIQGRHLVDFDGIPSRDTYVKLSLIPDPEMRTFCETEVVCDTSCPSYSEKFSIELLAEDRHKRLLLSVWSLDVKNKSHLVGCMSFGVRRLLEASKVYTGWFYLLSPELGRSKHLQVQPLEDNSQVVRTERLKVALRRGTGGYGMSLTGSCPVRVSKVLEGSPAFFGGLQVGDIIDRVNGHQVATFTQDGVVRVIKHGGNSVILEVLRTVSMKVEGSRKPRLQLQCNLNLLPSHQSLPSPPTPEEEEEELALVVDSSLQRAVPKPPKSIIRRNRKGSFRNSNRVSFSEMVTCQPIMKVADLMELFRDED